MEINMAVSLGEASPARRPTAIYINHPNLISSAARLFDTSAFGLSDG